MPLIPCDICEHPIASIAPSCPKCGAENAALARAALTAETLLRSPCEICDHAITQLDEYCPSCGAPNKAFDKIALMDFVGCDHEVDKTDEFCPKCGELNIGFDPRDKVKTNEKRLLTSAPVKITPDVTDEKNSYEEYGSCPKCNQSIPLHAVSCDNCGHANATCRTCRTLNYTYDTSCKNCGQIHFKSGSKLFLTQCSNCHGDMADLAESCLHCGQINQYYANLKSEMAREKFIKISIGIVFGLAIFIWLISLSY